MVSNIIYSCVSDSLLKKQMGLLRIYINNGTRIEWKGRGKEITQLGYPDSERGLDISIKPMWEVPIVCLCGQSSDLELTESNKKGIYVDNIYG